MQLFLLRMTLTLTFSALLSGCVSTAIVSFAGKRYKHLLNSSIDAKCVQRQLGEPFWRKEYAPPLPIKCTDEYKTRLTEDKTKSFIWGVHETAESRLASVCEVYKIKGPLQDQERGQAYGMAVGCTFGLAEVLDPIFIPISIRQMTDKHWWYLTFWYDQENRYVGYYEGDIRTGARAEPGAPFIPE